MSGSDPNPDKPASLEAELAEEMARWEAAGLRRQLASTIAPSGRGRVDFVSNDYLGLSTHPGIVAAAREALAEHGAGGRASRLLGGGADLHGRAEEAAADWLGAEAALMFPSGYQANLGLVGSLVGRGDAVFSDARNHASLIDAARLSRARVLVHRHLDFEELDTQLARAGTARRKLVLTEGVFSMDGDMPDLERLAAVCAKHGAWLIVDEAHSAGLLGPGGAGAWAAIRDRADPSPLVARVLTGGKSLGAGGAFVVGARSLREHLVNRARGFVFTTAPSPATAGALEAAIETARGADEARRQTLELAKGVARTLSLPEPAAAIVPWTTGGAERAVELSGSLQESGFDVRAVRPPTVPPGHSGLRIVLHAFNTAAECDELARRLNETPAPASVPASPARGESADEHRRPLFVVGTDTEIGKTVVSALLVRAARRLGNVAYWKPVQTGDDSDTNTVRHLSEAEEHELLRPAWSLPLPASPHEAAWDAGVSIDPARLEEGLDGLRRMLSESHLVVELAGGLLVPYRIEPALHTQADWLAKARADLVLVARSSLGTLNHTLLTLEALRARHLEPRALFLVGDEHPANARTLREVTGIPRVFELPFLDDLGPAALDAWLDAHPLDDVVR